MVLLEIKNFGSILIFKITNGSYYHLISCFLYCVFASVTFEQCSGDLCSEVIVLLWADKVCEAESRMETLFGKGLHNN